MSQLESLLSIARLQSSRQLELLQVKKQFIATMDKQLLELINYSRTYQKDSVGIDGHLSTLLQHKQKFVSQLRSQIDDLTVRISQLNVDAEECAAEWHSLEARQKAIESMYVKSCKQEEYEVSKADQAMLDEIAILCVDKSAEATQGRGIANA